jgi:hypothetical protein
MNRGDRREAIFADDDDRHRFLQTLGEACVSADKGGGAIQEPSPAHENIRTPKRVTTN